MKIFNMKNRIMFGVYILYCVRKLKNPFVVESFVLALLALALSASVSVRSVVTNMLDSQDIYRYFTIAFSNTDLMVQSMVILTCITLFLFVRNFTFHAILKTRLI